MNNLRKIKAWTFENAKEETVFLGFFSSFRYDEMSFNQDPGEEKPLPRHSLYTENCELLCFTE